MYQTDPKHLYMRWENEEKKLLLFTAIILILKLETLAGQVDVCRSLGAKGPFGTYV